MPRRSLTEELTQPSCRILRYDLVLYSMVKNPAQLFDDRCDGILRKVLFNDQRGNKFLHVCSDDLIEVPNIECKEEVIFEVALITSGS